MLEDNPTPPPSEDFLDNSQDMAPTTPEIMKSIHEELGKLEAAVESAPNGASTLGLLEVDRSDQGIGIVNASPDNTLSMQAYLPDDHSEDRILRLIRASVVFYPPWEVGHDIVFDIYPDKIERRHEEHLDFNQAAQTDGHEDEERLLNYLKTLDENDESARQLREMLGMDKEGIETSVAVLQFIMHLNDVSKLAPK